MLKKRILAGICCLSFVIFSNSLWAESKPLTRKGALMIAEQTEEVKGLYDLSDGKYLNCIEKSVDRSCESDLVTCVDDAWVVLFELGEICGVNHDGRLSVMFLINSLTGEIISRFPERQYFENESYCLDPQDCLSVKPVDSQEPLCRNFIHGQIAKNVLSVDDQCTCKKNVCISIENEQTAE